MQQKNANHINNINNINNIRMSAMKLNPLQQSSNAGPGVTTLRLKQIAVAALLLGSLPFAALTVHAQEATAVPGIDPGSMYEYMEPGKSTMLKRVRNTGPNTAFVRIELAEIMVGKDGAQATEQAVAPVMHGKGVQANTLVSSPARMIIPGNGQQSTRLLHLGSRDKEHYYRVRYIPVVPQANDDFGLNEGEIKEAEESMGAGLKVLSGYGGVLVVRPGNAHYKTVTRDEGTQYVVANNGNTSIALDNLYECLPKDKREDKDKDGELDSACGDPQNVHILPGRSHAIAKVAGAKYRFELTEGAKTRHVEF